MLALILTETKPKTTTTINIQTKNNKALFLLGSHVHWKLFFVIFDIHIGACIK